MTNPPAWLARVTAIAVVLLLLAGIVSAVAVGREDDTAEPTSGRRSPPSTPPSTSTSTTAGGGAVPAAVAAAVTELSAFVAAQRGLEFEQPVPVQLLDGDAFNQRLFADSEQDRADVEESERVLRALKLIPPDVDLFDTVQSFLGDSVLGFYDPKTNELVVRGAELTPYVRITLVHELTHALDDQRFELDRPALADADDERFTGFQALFEGNAVRIENAYRASLSAGEQKQADEEEAQFGAAIDVSGVPPIVPDLLSFPYLAGPTFVDALLQDGGETRVNDALRNPPTTSEQILHPGSFLDKEPVRQVPLPAADGKVIDQGTYGEWVLLLTLAQEMPIEKARAAAAGWGGDAYVAWADGTRACLRATFVSDTPKDHQELDAAWREWAKGHGEAQVRTTDAEVTVTACG